jgi:hypothetical protein
MRAVVMVTVPPDSLAQNGVGVVHLLEMVKESFLGSVAVLVY